MSDHRVFSRREAIKFAVAATVTVLVRAQLPGSRCSSEPRQRCYPRGWSRCWRIRKARELSGASICLNIPRKQMWTALLEQIASRIVAGDVGLFNTTDHALREQLDRYGSRGFRS